MHWLDFLIACCVGSLLGIAFCSWLGKRSERERNLEIELSLQKEMEQLKAMKGKE